MSKSGYHSAQAGGAAQHGDLPEAVRPLIDVVDRVALDVHARGEHGVGPLEVRLGRRRHVLVDETDLPVARDRCGDQEEPLRRHEGAHAPQERIGVVERPERPRVVGKDAKDAAARLHGPEKPTG